MTKHSWVLVGRPNSGKSTVYNTLTDGRARVGNFAGITVDILEGTLKLPSGEDVTVFDLPGLYTLSERADADTDEGVARDFIRSHPEASLLHVVDGTQLSLGLRLHAELSALKRPLALVVTQQDRMMSDGLTLDAVALEAALGTPVRIVTGRVKDALPAIFSAALAASAPAVMLADRPQVLADRVLTRTARRTASATARLDRVLLHPLVGPLLFLLLMTSAFAAIFLIAAPASALIDSVLGRLGAAIVRVLGPGNLSSFFVDGVLGGAGTVLAFAPQIVLLSMIMEVLDASGYLARGAFLVDRVFRLFGLTGRSFLPLLMGHACAVPAIAATRIVRDPRERLATILVLPLMTCSARIPTYALLLSTFFQSRGVLFRACAFVALYLLGSLFGVLGSLLLRRTVIRGKALPLVLEIPAYRVPEWRVVLAKARQSAARFFRDIGGTILAATVGLWVLLHVPLPGREGTSPVDRSVAAAVGQTLEPVTSLAGFDWRINVALLGSFGARELMVGTMGVIMGVEGADEDPAPLAERLRTAKRDDGAARYTTATGLALLIFFVLACQCVSTVAAIRRETKSLKWPVFVLVYTYALGFGAAVLVYQGAKLLGIT
jgi:ferrous iron transport protein B